MDKEKITQIYEVMADITLQTLEHMREVNKGVVILDKVVLDMVQTTQSLYETVNREDPVITAVCDEKVIV